MYKDENLEVRIGIAKCISAYINNVGADQL